MAAKKAEKPVVEPEAEPEEAPPSEDAQKVDPLRDWSKDPEDAE